MAKKTKTPTERYKDIFCKLHSLQIHGADSLILLMTGYIRGRADYMSLYIDLVAERSGVSQTGRITTTNADIMLPIVREMIRIDEGLEPPHKLLAEAWEAFISEFRNHKIK